jgi:BlaI family transcriptional regulator, penicillinase repressor
VKKDLDLDKILLTRGELQIMRVVWDKGVATVEDVRKALCVQKSIAQTTVQTFMKILEKKGALVHTRSGRAFLYRPILSRERATRNHVRDSIERYFDGRPEKLLIDVLTNEIISTEQIGNTRNLLDLWQENEVA